MDNKLLSFLGKISGNGRLAAVAAMLVLGIVLLMLGGGAESSDEIDRGEELRELCSEVEGVGDCRVMMTLSAEGEVVSVAVLCDGAESTRVKASLCELISELYGIGTNRISILKLAK